MVMVGCTGSMLIRWVMITFSPRLSKGLWYLAIPRGSFDSVSCSHRVPKRFKSAYARCRSASALVSILQSQSVSVCVCVSLCQ